MDLALVIDKLVPGADYRRADDLAALTATWEDARPIPSEEEINAAWTEIEAAQAAVVTRSATRTALREQWDSLPAWIRGPFQDKFAAANVLLDAGQDDAAAALIEYAEVPSSYTPEQVATFNAVRTQFLAAISSL